MNTMHTGFLIRPALLGALLVTAVTSPAFATDPAAGRDASQGASLVGGALPGGAVISARSVAVAPAAGGYTVSVPIDSDGNFKLAGLKPGTYKLQLASVVVGKQTQTQSFGEKVNAGLGQTGNAVQQGAARNINNINGGMPNRISMNVTVARQTGLAEVDGAPIGVSVGPDGNLSGKVSAK
jgi:hypothetical protein